MLKISESALVPKLLTTKGMALFKKPGFGARGAYTHLQKPVKSFEAHSVVPKEHPLISFKEDATRGIVAKKRGLIGKPVHEMHDWHSKRSAPVRTPDPKPDFHPTKPTTDTVDWHHKETPTTKTYTKIKRAIKQVS